MAVLTAVIGTVPAKAAPTLVVDQQQAANFVAGVDLQPATAGPYAQIITAGRTGPLTEVQVFADHDCASGFTAQIQTVTRLASRVDQSWPRRP
jgi:cell wall assembly regulator SMI1